MLIIHLTPRGASLIDAQIRYFVCPTCSARRGHVSDAPAPLVAGRLDMVPTGSRTIPLAAAQFPVAVPLLVAQECSRSGLTFSHVSAGEALDAAWPVTRGYGEHAQLVPLVRVTAVLRSAAIAAALGLPFLAEALEARIETVLVGTSLAPEDVYPEERLCRDCAIRVIETHPAARRQGHLIVAPCDEITASIPWPGYYAVAPAEPGTFFNHHVPATADLAVRRDADRLTSPFATISSSAEIVIGAADHKEMVLDAGSYIAYHPFPRRNGGAD